MAIELIGISKKGSSSTFTISLPSGVQEGDYILAFLHSANQDCGIAPSGTQNSWYENQCFTRLPGFPVSIGTAGIAGGVRLDAFGTRVIKAMTNSVDYYFNVSDSGSTNYAALIVLRGVDATNSLDVSIASSTGSLGDIVFPALATATNSSAVFNVVALDNDADNADNVSNWANPDLTGVTEIADNTISSGNGGGLAVAWGIKDLAGSVQGTTASISTPLNHAEATVALRDATPGGGTPQPEQHSGDSALSISHALSAVAKKGSSGDAAITQEYSLTGIAKKVGKNTISISQDVSITVAGKAIKKSNNSLSQAHFVASTGTKKALVDSILSSDIVLDSIGRALESRVGISDIMQATTLQATGKKKAKSASEIQAPTVVTVMSGRKGAFIILDNVMTIPQLESLGKKTAYGDIVELIGNVFMTRGHGAQFCVTDIVILQVSRESGIMLSAIITADYEELNITRSVTQEVIWTMGNEVKGETIRMRAGTTKMISIIAVDKQGNPSVLSGATAKFAIDGILADKPCDIDGNKISVTIEPGETKSAFESLYEFRIKDADGLVESLIVGDIIASKKIVQNI